MTRSEPRQLSTALLALAAMHCRAGAPRLATDELAGHLATLTEWTLTGDRLVREFPFAGYHETIAFVNAVAWIAQREDHHPELSVGYSRCAVSFTTHDAAGITLNDVICAAKTQRLFA